MAVDFVARLMEIYDKARFEAVARSYCLAGKEERRGRLRAVIALSAELERIRAVNIFATGLGEGVIEDIIEGSWDTALSIGMGFTFSDEAEDVQKRYAPLWAKFVEIVRVECALAQQRARVLDPCPPD